MPHDAQLESLRDQIRALGPRARGRRFPDHLRARVIAYVAGRTGAGESGAAVSTALGVPWQTVSRWRDEARDHAQRLIPVEVVAAQPRTLTLRSPKGFVLEGLDLDTAVELLARLG